MRASRNAERGVWWAGYLEPGACLPVATHRVTKSLFSVDWGRWPMIAPTVGGELMDGLSDVGKVPAGLSGSDPIRASRAKNSLGDRPWST
jgi:hypothetical protein